MTKKTFQYWLSDDFFMVSCTRCGSEVEFWKDELSQYCQVCGKLNSNPQKNIKCAAWCKYADQCRRTRGKTTSAQSQTHKT